MTTTPDEHATPADAQTPAAAVPLPASAQVDRPTIAAGVYEHYKGDRYLVMGLAHDSNHEGRVAVIYVPLYDAPGPRMAIRDEADFHALLHLDNSVCDDVTCIAGWDTQPHRPRFRLVTE